MGKTIRRKSACRRFKDQHVTPIENIKVIYGVVMELSDYYAGWVIAFVRKRYGPFHSAKEFNKWQAARFHSDKLFNHPSDTFLRRLHNTQYRLDSKRQIDRAIREMKEDQLSLLRKKVQSGWLD